MLVRNVPCQIMTFSSIRPVNTSPVIQEQIQKPSTVFSATAHCTLWVINAVVLSLIPKMDSRIAPTACVRTSGKTMHPSASNCKT